MNIWFEDYQEYIWTLFDDDPFNNEIPCWKTGYESQMERERR
jgi:hypothetical protein